VVHHTSSPASTTRAAATIGTGLLFPSSTMYDLSIFRPTDADLSMRTHIQRTVAGCFATTSQQSAICSISGFSDAGCCTLCCLNLTTAMLHWLVFRPANSAVFSLFSMPLLGWPSVFDDLTTSQTCLPVFHWLRASERVTFKLAVIIYRAVHGMAPQYLSELGLLYRVANIPSRRCLRSSTSDDLFVPPSRLVSVGDRSFAAAAHRLWNILPDDISSAPPLSDFRHKQDYFGSLILTLFFSLSCC